MVREQQVVELGFQCLGRWCFHLESFRPNSKGGNSLEDTPQEGWNEVTVSIQGGGTKSSKAVAQRVFHCRAIDADRKESLFPASCLRHK